MNSNQKIVLVSSVTLIVLQALIPPWTQVTDRMTYALDYSFIGAPPVDASGLDFTRLIVGWVVTTGIGALLYMVCKSKQ